MAAAGTCVRSHGTAYKRFYHVARQQELVRADALTYPRVRHERAVMRVADFRARFGHLQPCAVGEDEVVLRGRLRHVRRAGTKLVFLAMTAEFEPVQGMCNFRMVQESGVTLDAFRTRTRLWKRGDLIAIRGRPMRTKTGELSIDASEMPELLAPNLVPLPTRLQDGDTRMQRRHVDLLVNRPTLDVLRLRAGLIKYVRSFLDARSFVEVQTPILAAHAGGAVARPFATRAVELPSRELALRIAPELWLKRLVVAGVERVFEIGPVFRNEGIDQSHNPEFTTCEFYLAYAGLDNLVALTEDLIGGAAEHCRELIDTSLTSLPPVRMDAYTRPFRRIHFVPALEAALGFALPDLAAPEALPRLVSLLRTHGIAVREHAHESLPKLLDRLAAQHLESHSVAEPLFITHHPVCMSPLAKSFVCPTSKQMVSARAELFVAGREIANMYEEENDPFEQRRKLIQQARNRDDDEGGGGDADAVIDESYIDALESGLPPTGGWGCGIERLLMLFAGTTRISDCLSFGNLRNVAGLATGRGQKI